MSGSVNKVIIVGNLGKDPEVRYTPAGQACCKMNIATTRIYRDKEEHKQERTDWHKVVAWGKTAELCRQYLSKGRSVYVEGRLQHDRVEGKDGTPRYFTDVVGERIVFLGGGRGGSGSGGGSGSASESCGGSSSGVEESSEPQEEASPPSPEAARRPSVGDDIPF